MMLYLIPPLSPGQSPDLPAGTVYRVLSSRDDLHTDSAGNKCHVIQSEDLLDLEPVPKEQFEALGDLKDCISPWETVKEPEDKDAQFVTEQAALIDRIYGPESAKSISIKEAVSIALAPVVIKKVGG